MKTIYDMEFKRSKALGAFVPYGGQTSVQWTEWAGKEGEAYRKNAIVYTCVHEIATSAASVPFKVQVKETQEEQNNEISKLLEVPNPMQDRTTFWEAVYAFYQLKGNVSIEAAPYNGSVVKELFCIPFDYTTIKLNKAGMVNKYIVKPTNNIVNDKIFRVSSITGKTKLLHLHTFNPDDLWVGLSPLEAAGRDADLFNESGKWNKGLLTNAARPTGVFSYDDTDGGILTSDAYDRLKKEIVEEYVGATNVGTPILLEGGLKWQGTSFNPTEMDFLESRAASARVVASVFGYPAMLLGLSGDNTYNNQKEARLALWTDTIMPLTDKVGVQLTTFFQRLGILDPGQEIVPNYEDIGALQPIRDKVWDKASEKGKTFLTVNERRKLVNYPEITGYDGIVANAAQVPLDFALSDPATRGAVEIVRDNTTIKPNKNKD